MDCDMDFEAMAAAAGNDPDFDQVSEAKTSIKGKPKKATKGKPKKATKGKPKTSTKGKPKKATKGKRKTTEQAEEGFTIAEEWDIHHVVELLQSDIDLERGKPGITKIIADKMLYGGATVFSDSTKGFPKLLGGRRYAKGPSLQAMPRELRRKLVPPHTFEIDVVNCAPTIMLHYFSRFGPDVYHLRRYATHRDAVLEEVARDLKCTKAKAKELCLLTLNGGCFNKHMGETMTAAKFVHCDYLTQLKGEIAACTSMLLKSSELKTLKAEVKAAAVEDITEYALKTKTLATLFERAERKAVDTVLEMCQGKGFKVSCVVHDGVLVQYKPLTYWEIPQECKDEDEDDEDGDDGHAKDEQRKRKEGATAMAVLCDDIEKELRRRFPNEAMAELKLAAKPMEPLESDFKTWPKKTRKFNEVSIVPEGFVQATEFEGDVRCIAQKASMAGGKTTAMKTRLETQCSTTQRILMPTCRIGQAVAVTGLLKGEVLLDKRKLPYKIFTYREEDNRVMCAAAPGIYIVQWESLHRLIQERDEENDTVINKFDMLIVDEIRSVLTQAVSMETNRQHLKTNLTVFRGLCEMTPKVLLLDADLMMDDMVARFCMKQFGGVWSPEELRVEEYAEQKMKRTLRLCNDADLFLAKLCGAIGQARSFRLKTGVSKPVFVAARARTGMMAILRTVTGSPMPGFLKDEVLETDGPEIETSPNGKPIFEKDESGQRVPKLLCDFDGNPVMVETDVPVLKDGQQVFKDNFVAFWSSKSTDQELDAWTDIDAFIRANPLDLMITTSKITVCADMKYPVHSVWILGNSFGGCTVRDLFQTAGRAREPEDKTISFLLPDTKANQKWKDKLEKEKPDEYEDYGFDDTVAEPPEFQAIKNELRKSGTLRQKYIKLLRGELQNKFSPSADGQFLILDMPRSPEWVLDLVAEVEFEARKNLDFVTAVIEAACYKRWELEFITQIPEPLQKGQEEALSEFNRQKGLVTAFIKEADKELLEKVQKLGEEELLRLADTRTPDGSTKDQVYMAKFVRAFPAIRDKLTIEHKKYYAKNAAVFNLCEKVFSTSLDTLKAGDVSRIVCGSGLMEDAVCHVLVRHHLKSFLTAAGVSWGAFADLQPPHAETKEALQAQTKEDMPKTPGLTTFFKDMKKNHKPMQKALHLLNEALTRKRQTFDTNSKGTIDMFKNVLAKFGRKAVKDKEGGTFTVGLHPSFIPLMTCYVPFHTYPTATLDASMLAASKRLETEKRKKVYLKPKIPRLSQTKLKRQKLN
jgi:hypothetical protein